MTESDYGLTQHAKDGYLEGLPASIRRYHYKGRHHFRRTYELEFGRLQRALEFSRQQRSSQHDHRPCSPQPDNSQCSPRPDHLQRSTRNLQSLSEESFTSEEQSEYILFYIDPADIAHDFLDPETCYFQHRISYFDTTKGLLLVKMITPEHGAATAALGYEITRQVDLMGLREVITAFSGSGIRADSKGKDADYGWGPTRPPPSGRRLAVALEVSVSETQEKLNLDVDFWLNRPKENANVALTLKISRNNPTVTFDKWEWVDQRSHRTQHITVSKNSSDHVTVSGSPITIPSDLLFQRPISYPAEGNIQLADNELQYIAGEIWEQQGF